MSRLRSVRSPDERGATLALIALSLAALIGLAALVIDVGRSRYTRQTLISATDSAALAAVQDLVEAPGNGPGACGTAGSYLGGNAAGATMTGCEITSFGPAGGRVTVSATEAVNDAFAATGGDDGRAVLSVSSATWGPPVTVTGLRPVAFCYAGSSTLRQLIDTPPATPTTVRVQFTPDGPSACGDPAVGNFATLRFEGGAGIHTIRDWVRHGYPGQVGFDAPTTTGCASPVPCFERPYALLDIGSQLGSLRDSRSYVTFPVFDYADATAVHLIGVVRARVSSFRLQGSPGDWFVELKVDPGLITGNCCGAPAVDAGNRVIALCGVDPGAVGGCEPDTGP